MKWLLLAMLLLSYHFGCCQQRNYAFEYKYDLITKSDNLVPSLDSAGLTKHMVDELIPTVYLAGSTCSNGILLTLSSKKQNKLRDTVMLPGGYKVNVNINANNQSGNVAIFYSDSIAVQIDNTDTICTYIDSTVVFHKTKGKRTIKGWPCEEYKSDLKEYNAVSIWASKKIPGVVAPGRFKGVPDGVAEIDNNEKNVKLVLLEYTGSNNGVAPAFNYAKKPDGIYKFIDAFK